MLEGPTASRAREEQRNPGRPRSIKAESRAHSRAPGRKQGNGTRVHRHGDDDSRALVLPMPLCDFSSRQWNGSISRILLEWGGEV